MVIKRHASDISSDNEWQRETTSGSFSLFSLFWIREKPITKQPNESSLNFEGKPSRETFELQKTTKEKILTVKRKNWDFLFVIYTTLKTYEDSMKQT